QARRDPALHGRLSRGDRLDVLRSEGGRDVLEEGASADRALEGVDGEIPAEGDGADDRVQGSRRRRERRGEAEVPRQAADRGAAQGADRHAAGPEISRLRSLETERAAAMQRPFLIAS